MRAFSAPMVLLAACAFSCASDEPAASSADDAAEILDVREGGAADEAGFAVTEVGGAGRYTIDVRSLAPGASVTLPNLEGVAHAFELRLAEPASVAFIARVTDGDVDPHVVSKDSANETMAIGRDQSILPMASERDAVVTFEADAETSYVFVVADEDLDSDGVVTVDVVLFSEPLGVDLGWTHAGTRAVAEMLRQREPELAEHLAAGVVLEEVDGYVAVGDLTSLPLSERADVNALIADVNELRSILYEEYSEERPDAVGRAAAELYWVARAP